MGECRQQRKGSEIHAIVDDIVSNFDTRGTKVQVSRKQIPTMTR